MRILVTTCDNSGPVPPWGYGGLTRLAWALAYELTQLGVEVALSAPVQEPRRAPVGSPRLVPWPPPDEELAFADCVYTTEADCLLYFSSAIGSFPDKLFVGEHNAPWIHALRAPNVRHVVYRSDLLPLFDLGEARLFDQVLIREEIGPPIDNTGELLWLGRIHPDKAPGKLVSFAEHIDRPIRVVGPSQMHEPSWPCNVIRQGSVSGEEKAALLRSASAFIYTVAPTWFGAGEGVLTEAAACGLPILALSYSSGCPSGRLVMDGINGYRRNCIEELAALVPFVMQLNKNKIHELMWPRLEPRRVAGIRLEWIEEQLDQIRSSRLGIKKDSRSILVERSQVDSAAKPVLNAFTFLWEFLVRHDERVKARHLLDLTPWMLENHPGLERFHRWGQQLDRHLNDLETFRSFYRRSRGAEDFIPVHVDSGTWTPRALLAVRIIGHIASRGKILEVGCHDGTVGFPIAVSYPKANYCGYDLNSNALERFRKILQNAGIQARLVTELPIGETFDVVILAELLEHVARPAQEVANILKLIKPGGWLLITTPWGSHEQGLTDYDPGSEDSFHHLWVFTERSLSAILYNAGLMVRWMVRIPSERPGAQTIAVVAVRGSDY